MAKGFDKPEIVQSFNTGAVRDVAEDKPRMELLSPFTEEQLAWHLTNGAKKYDDRNWEKGIPFDRTIASCLRHINAFRQGKTDEDHLVAAYCNLHFLLHYREMIKRGVLPSYLDDMPKYNPTYCAECDYTGWGVDQDGNPMGCPCCNNEELKPRGEGNEQQV